MGFIERRHTLRVPVGGTVIEHNLSIEQQVRAVNISEHGMYYCRPLDSEEIQDNEVFLTITLLERLEPIKVLGWVVDTRQTQDCIETHVTFMFLSEKDEAIIKDYVASRQNDTAKLN